MGDESPGFLYTCDGSHTIALLSVWGAVERKDEV